MKFTILSIDGVKNFKYMSFGLLLCLWSDESEFKTLLWFLSVFAKFASDC